MVVDDGLEFVASWYAILKVGAVTAEVYTFLPAEGPRLLPRLHARRDRDRRRLRARPLPRGRRREPPPARDARRRRRAGRARAGRAHLRGARRGGARHGARPSRPRATTSRSGSSRPGAPARPRPACTCTHTPLLSIECYARAVLGMGEDDVVLPVPKLFFGYARDLTALYPFAVGGAGIVFPQRTTAERIFELDRPPPPDDARERADDDAGDGRARDRRRAGPELPARVHVGRRGAARASCTTAGSSASASRSSTGSAPPRRTTSTSPAGRGGPARERWARSSPATRRASSAPDGRDVARRRDRAPVRARAERRAHVLRRAREVRGDVRRRRRDVRRPLLARRGRHVHLPRPRGRPAEGGRHLGRAGRDRGVPARASRRRGRRRRRLPRGRPAAAACVRRARAAGADPGDALAAALQAHVRSTLSPHKFPRDLRFVAELPKTGSGKVDRQALREGVA